MYRYLPDNILWAFFWEGGEFEPYFGIDFENFTKCFFSFGVDIIIVKS